MLLRLHLNQRGACYAMHVETWEVADGIDFTVEYDTPWSRRWMLRSRRLIHLCSGSNPYVKSLLRTISDLPTNEQCRMARCDLATQTHLLGCDQRKERQAPSMVTSWSPDDVGPRRKTNKKTSKISPWHSWNLRPSLSLACPLALTGVGR